MGIFRQYDVRGTYPTQIDEDSTYRIGYYYAKYVKTGPVIVARDVRISGPSLQKAFMNGIRDAGLDVIDAGVCTTPQIHFLSRESNAAIITASHNPKKYNGIKLYRVGGHSIAKGSGLDEIEKRYAKGTEPKVAETKGKKSSKSYSKAYVEHLSTFAKKIDTTVKLVVDCSNGSAGKILPALSKSIGIKPVKLYWDLDGEFPNHSPNPLKRKSVAACRREIKKHKAHLGVIFDADADRALFLNDLGDIIPPEHITTLLASKIRSPRVVHDLRMGWVLKEELRKMEGEGIVSKVGRTNIYKEMRLHRAHLGVELSGHYYFKDNKYADDGIIAMIKLLRVISSKERLSDQLRTLDRYAKSDEVNFEVEERQKLITKVYNTVQKKYRGCKIDFLDGLTVDCKDWWFNIRPSNTQPVVRVVCQAKDEKQLDKRLRFIKKLIGA